MDIREHIQNLIPLLDNRNDALLIAMLSEKISESVVRINGKTYIDENDMFWTDKGVTQMLSNLLYDTLKYKKLQDIISGNRCINCKYHVRKKMVSRIAGTYYVSTMDETDRCDRCGKREDIFWVELEKETDRIRANISKTIEDNNELIECKAILNKLKLKLRNYDASKHKVNV